MRMTLAAIALLSLTGVSAFAQALTFSGSAGMGVRYDGATKTMVGTEDDLTEVTEMESKLQWRSDFDISISGSGTTDGGLTFGATVAIEANQAGDDEITDSEVFIGGESWTVTIGTLDPASHMGRSLGDVGYTGLGVDDVAEKAGGYGGSVANVALTFNLGSAKLGITAGQKPGNKTVTETSKKIDPVEMDPLEREPMTTFLGIVSTDNLNADENIAMLQSEPEELGSYNDYGTYSYEWDSTPDDLTDQDSTLNKFDIYVRAGQIYKVVGGAQDVIKRNEDGVPVDADGDRVTDPSKYVYEPAEGDTDPNREGTQADTADEPITNEDINGSNKIVVTNITPAVEPGERDAGNPGKPAETVVMKAATKEDTEWAAGVSFALGSTTLGIGVDSEKLMQAGIAADLGAFTGGLFYSQQKTTNAKNTGMGVELGVMAGAGTKINAVYARGKVDHDNNEMDSTAKGFGLGVTHDLGGGATLKAGFAKVEDQTRADVGVSMSF